MTATVETDPQAPARNPWPQPGHLAHEPHGPGPGDHRRTILAVAVAAVLGAATIGAIVTAGSSDEPETIVSTAAGSETADDSAAAPAGDVIQAAALPDLEGNLGQNELEPEAEVESERADGGCTIGALSIRLGSEGTGVTCLQEALAEQGYYSGTASGVFDDATLRATMQYQEDEGLFVDGIVGRESAIELGIWPDEASLVVHTPPPAPGAMDSMGYPLSVVASTGSDAPPLPEGSGSGRRVVYDRAGQRVWAVGEDGQIIRSWLVSGSKYMNEMPGTHTVYSRSEMSTAWNGQAWLPNMIRYQKTEIGHIGFHAIPLHVSDNSVYQTSDELGTRLSGGCQRQANEDADFMWAFADIGTTVVVT
ncbi:MAG: L,D-transpeptidase family protein [Ilumatobacteraceae bacterium]